MEIGGNTGRKTTTSGEGETIHKEKRNLKGKDFPHSTIKKEKRDWWSFIEWSK